MFTSIKFSSRTFAAATLLLASTFAHAQVVGGTIAGIVTDPTGAIVQHAEVVVRNEETGTHRPLPTGDDGRFAAISIRWPLHPHHASRGVCQLQAHQSPAHRRPVHQPSRHSCHYRQ